MNRCTFLFLNVESIISVCRVESKYMRRLIRRSLVLTLMLLAIAAAYAQSSLSVNPGITVVVTEHPLTSEDVEVTAFDPNYPAQLLRQQIETIGKLLGSPPRGVAVVVQQIDPAKPELKFLKARFAVNGLIERSTGELRLEPIIKAFAGAPAPYTLEGITILFDGESPTENTIRRYDVPGAFLSEAQIVSSPSESGAPGIEYTIKYLSQDPNKMVYPSKRVEPKSAETASQPAGQLPGYVWIAIIVAGLSAGALVYLALAKRTPVRR